MRGLSERLVAAVATFGSFVVLVVDLKKSDENFTALQIILMTVAVIAFVVTAAFDFADYRARKLKVMKTDREIRDYMFKWIKGGGKVAVFSRSLGWVDDAEMRDMMRRKAQQGDLTLVMPGPVPASRELADEGAEAIYYGAGGYTIRSRFTIIHRERSDTTVAIGRQSREGKHIVSEFKSSDEAPAFWLAEDLIEIVKSYERGRKVAGTEQQ